jgi:hypothetical protein
VRHPSFKGGRICENRIDGLERPERDTPASLAKVTGAVGLDGSPPAVPYSVQPRGRIAAGLSDVSRMGKSVEADPTNAARATPRPAQGFLKIVK